MKSMHRSQQGSRFRAMLAAVTVCVIISGCADRKAATDAAATPTGADRDAHGCIGSAGYSWCASTGQCERPWELAEQQGFDNTAEGFAQFCSQ